MNHKLTVGIALAAGILGGLVTRYVEPQAALAQAQPAAQAEVRGQNFAFVDSRNNVIATLSVESSPYSSQWQIGKPPQATPGLILRDSSGRVLWTTAEGSPFRRLSENR